MYFQHKRLALITMLFFTALIARAQDFSPLADFATSIGTSTAQSHAWGDVMRDVYGKGSQSDKTSSSAGHARMTATTAKAQLTYQPTAETTSAAIATYVSAIRKSDPEGAAKTAEALEHANISVLYSTLVAPYGLIDGNLADSFTAYTVLGWMIVNGQNDIPPKTVQGTRDKFALQLVHNPIANAANAGEMLKLLFVTLDAGWQSARKNGTEKAYRENVAGQFASTGLDFKKLKLTPTGFAFR